MRRASEIVHCLKRITKMEDQLRTLTKSVEGHDGRLARLERRR